MYKDVLRSITQVELFPVIGIIIFMGFFTIVSIYALRLSKKEVSKLESIPFDAAEESIDQDVLHTN